MTKANVRYKERCLINGSFYGFVSFGGGGENEAVLITGISECIEM
jgi:hypothetical protein